MKVFILAGGYGTRFAEMTDKIPKPMICIGDFPILIHIMSHYSSYGIVDFEILAGYKNEVIEEYFSTGEGKRISLKNSWKVKVIDSGIGTSTAGRIAGIGAMLPETFMLTYGDGLGNINLNQLLKEHQNTGLTATVTAVHPPARFGTLELFGKKVVSFKEKDSQKTGWINGGFFCLSKEILNYIIDAEKSLESEPMELLVSKEQLGAFPHEDFWHPMDTLRDQRILENIFLSGNASWNTDALG